MLHDAVKKSADARDYEGLWYIFVDCLDVDPTFEKYQEDYDYCKDLEGFFQKNRDLTPFETDSTKWDRNYWTDLKTDLLENFSFERFEHMRKVVRVVHKEKIERLRKEQQALEQKQQAEQRQKEQQKTMSQASTVPPAQASKTKQQEENFRKRQEKIAAENAKVEAARANQERVLQDARKNLNNEQEKTSSKKFKGIVTALAVGVALVVTVTIILIATSR